jgi:hypothetical protein
MKITETKDGCIIEVTVKPRSKEFNVLLDADDIVIRSREEPVEGRVNKELIKELSKLFGKRVDIISGSTSKNKKLFVSGAKKSEVENVLKRK